MELHGLLPLIWLPTTVRDIFIDLVEQGIIFRIHCIDVIMKLGCLFLDGFLLYGIINMIRFRFLLWK